MSTELGSHVNNIECHTVDGASVDVLAPLDEAFEAETVLAYGGIADFLFAEGEQTNGTFYGVFIACVGAARDVQLIISLLGLACTVFVDCLRL